MTPTAEQQRAIDSDAKQILCIAGAGSGKTSTMVKRILRLIREGADPEQICVIVFTNDAARVIHEYLHPESGEFAINLGFLGTLHSFCLRLLQEFAGMGNVTVLDDEESDEELLRCAKAAGVKATPKELKALRQFWNVHQFDERRDGVHIAVASYYRKMESTRALDFNSILTKAFEYLSDCPDCLGKGVKLFEVPHAKPLPSTNLRDDAPVSMEKAFEFRREARPCPTCRTRQRPWAHLLVDEFQDASRLDFAIYMLIATLNRFFVGDPDQAIFGWRGGDVHGILECARSEEWEKVFLEGNFRCGAAICEVAQRLIEHDRERVPKSTRSLTDRESTVGRDSFESDVEESVRITEAVSVRIALKDEEPREIAVLARTNAIADSIAETLGAHGIPVRRRIAPEVPADWRMARAALRMLQARNDDSIIRFQRLVNPRAAALNERQAALGKLNLREIFMAGLECTVESIGRDLTRLRVSRASVERIEAMVAELPEPTMGDIVLTSAQKREHEEKGDGVSCTTIHGAKGREWNVVILAGFEEETIPGVRFLNVEEERRIAYVGMTRARRSLVITWAKARRENWGRRDYREMNPSRFLAEAGL